MMLRTIALAWQGQRCRPVADGHASALEPTSMDARVYYDADDDEANNVFASVSVYAMYIVVPLSIDDRTCIIILAQLL